MSLLHWKILPFTGLPTNLKVNINYLRKWVSVPCIKNRRLFLLFLDEETFFFVFPAQAGIQ